MEKNKVLFSRKLIIEEILAIIKKNKGVFTPEQLITRISVRSPFLSKEKADEYIYLLLEDEQFKLTEGKICLSQ